MFICLNTCIVMYAWWAARCSSCSCRGGCDKVTPTERESERNIYNVYTNTHTHTQSHSLTRTHTHTNKHTHTQTHAHTHAHTRTHTHEHTYTHIFTCKYIYMTINLYVCTSTQPTAVRIQVQQQLQQGRGGKL